MIKNFNQWLIGGFVISMLSISSLVMVELCYAENPPGSSYKTSPSKSPPPPGRTLLDGRIEPYGTFEVTCPTSVRDDTLTMSVGAREGDYAMCCVILSPPIEVRAGDEISSEVVLEQRERELHVKVETTEGRQIYLHNGSLSAGKSRPIRLLLDKRNLGGKESVQIEKFCIVAKGPGTSQTITINSASISSPKRQ